MSETLEWRPASLVRVRAEAPIPRCMAGPGLVAHVIVSKYGNSLPLHRQERIFEREGVSLARSTLCNWVGASTGLLKYVVDDFFAWAGGVYDRVRGVRGPVATAFGYATRHEQAFRRFLDDGRLRLENNASERALRHIAVGRKAWLFFGSDDHAHAGANLFSLIASCKLHGLDAETYLAEIIRVVPYWPRDRYLELAPKYWAATRARLDSAELERPIGHVTVPAATSAEQQATTG
ncbi:MAG TPA: transposase [Labilithrix sp.]|nr:transposase [Labilithrix sp.]